MSTFTPPLFSKFGTNSKGLFDNKFETDKHSIKSIRKSSNGFTAEVGANFKNPIFNDLTGYLKGTYAQKPYNLEFNANTAVTENSSATLKFNQLYPGLLVTATQHTSHQWAKEDKKLGLKEDKHSATVVEGTYTKDSISVHTEYKTDLQQSHQIKPSFSIGFDNFSFGANTQIDPTHPSNKFLDYNLGFEYVQPQFTATLTTEKKLDWAVASLFYKLKSNHNVAAQMKLQVVGNHENEITVGNEYKIDAATVVKSKLKYPSQELFVAVEHKLSNPSVAINFAAKYKPTSFGGPVKAEKFGLGLTFGDY